MTRNILLLVTGSVAAFKAAALASKLTQSGFDVRTVLSGSAKEFVGVATFEGLTRNRVYEGTFAPGDAMAHIELARWADLTLVYPASGNTLTKLAHGRADDLIGTLFLAHEFNRPYWVAPAMNPSMLAHPAVAEAVSKLKGWGVTVFDSDAGRTACGEVGTGRLIEPEVMYEEIKKHFFDSSPLGDRRILVTAGGTSESIDPVRVLTNVSTGETGVRVANALAESGNSVTLLLSESSSFFGQVLPGIRVVRYRSFGDLDRAMREELSTGRYDSLIHSAAVSDYRVEGMETVSGVPISGNVKIHSKESLILRLAPNPKILDRVRTYAGNSNLRVVSFKLSTPAVADGVADLSGYDSDLIVHNAVAGIERGSDRHSGEIFEKTPGGYRFRTRFETKTDLAKAITLAVNP